MIGQNYTRHPVVVPPVHEALSPPWEIDVLVATKDGVTPKGLGHVPSPAYHLITSQRPGWAKAANTVLDGATHDALFLDDDIELTPYTFALLAQCYSHADVFGFTLLTTQNQDCAQVTGISAGHVLNGDGQLVPQDGPTLFLPGYVAHVTASCFYLKRAVLEAGIRFPVWPGVHSEDVAFTYDCWLRGFKVVYLPGVAYHHLGGPGIGGTKAGEDDLGRKLAVNKLCLQEWMAEHHVAQAVADGVIPLGTRPLGGEET